MLHIVCGLMIVIAFQQVTMKNGSAEFQFFDPDGETDRSARNLPHWFQPGVVTFITFRTTDSLPRRAVAGIEHELKLWLLRHAPEADTQEGLPDLNQLPDSIRTQYARIKRRFWHGALDRSYGECVLRQPPLRQIVLQALLHFDGDRYDLASAVVMPNHVHVLAQFRAPHSCRLQCRSWLIYTARQINARLGRTGPFWQSEPFDHLVRSEDQFHYLERYIAENGPKAGLAPHEYTWWRRHSDGRS